MADNSVRKAIRGACVALALGVISFAAIAETIGIAATVNDGVITTTDVSERRDLVMATSNIAPTPENIQHVTPRVVQGLIDEALELQEAKRQSITITPEEVNKAMAEVPAAHGDAEALRKHLEGRGLSPRSLENQLRAQLAWNKVVQRKLKRNVIISKDEVARAQQAEANAPGINEIRLAALILPLGDKPEKAEALAKEIGAAITSGQSFSAIAQKYNTGRPDVKFNPPIWVVEDNLPQPVQQALHDVKPAMTSSLLRTPTSLQYIHVIDRRLTKQPASSTEVLIKQITIDIPAQSDKASIDKLTQSEKIVRADPGSCEDTNLPTTPLPSSAGFARLTMGNLSTEQRGILARLDVGGMSDPMLAQDKMRLVLLCERSEAAGTEKDLENLRQQLFAEKLELEAQKHLRNLRREASIDIREGK